LRIQEKDDMKISEYLKKETCTMDLKASKKDDAIREIATQISLTGKVKDIDRFIKDVLERESLGSTGIGHKVAIPHARTDSTEGFVIGFGRSMSGIDFAALDDEPVSCIFLMGANTAELNLYLRLLAELSKLLMQSSFRRALLEAKTSDDVIAAFKRFEADQTER
jgi:fructose-specific phosphotransferase system IIA component